jgi:hypothetical protein
MPALALPAFACCTRRPAACCTNSSTVEAQPAPATTEPAVLSLFGIEPPRGSVTAAPLSSPGEAELGFTIPVEKHSDFTDKEKFRNIRNIISNSNKFNLKNDRISLKYISKPSYMTIAYNNKEIRLNITTMSFIFVIAGCRSH